jgi:FkbM family methyltransferase
MLDLVSKLQRALESASLWRQSRAFRQKIEVRPRPDLLSLGSHYGHWIVPSELLGPDSVCYLVGIGTDISFDLALIERFGCTVHAFDPVPESQSFAAEAASHEPRFVLHPFGLWSSDTTIAFHQPVSEGFVSHSATDMHDTDVAFRADVRSPASVMRELGHEKVDLLKVSAEGSEYTILRSLAEQDIDATTVAVEFAQPAPRGAAERACSLMADRGYEIVHAEIHPRSRKLTFVRDRGSG